MEERAGITYEIAKYKFDATIDTMPTFNESYDLDCISVYDSDNGDGTITRTLRGLKPTSIIFAGCTGLLEVTMITIDGREYSELFKNCNNLTYVNMNNWIDNGVTHTGGMFRNCTSLTTIDMEDWDKTNLGNITSMFSGCSSLTTIKGVENLIGPKVQIGDYIFYNCSSLTEIDVSGWDNRIYDMRCMFGKCSNLTKIIGVEKLVTKYNGYIMDIFYNCSSLTEIDVSGWDVSNVVYGYSVFAGCSSLTELDLSNWDISKFNSLREMFNDCTNLRNVFMLNWNSSNCTSTYRAFYKCKNIKLLDFSNWDFKLVTSMNGMINGCTSLETIIFNNIDLRNVDVTYQLSTSSLPLLKNVIVKNSTAANINKLIELLPRGNSAINCKIYLPITQDMSNINVAAANAKGWKVTQGGIVYNVSKVLIEDTEILGLKSTKIARLKRGEFINDTIKKTVVGEVPNITYK